MSAYTPFFGDALPIELNGDAMPWLAERAVLDLPMRLRVFAMRMTMFIGATVITRDEAMREAAVKGSDLALQGFETVAAAIFEPERVLSHLPVQAGWLRAAVAARPGAAEDAEAFRRQSVACRKGIARGSFDSASYDAAMQIAYDRMTPSLTALADALTRSAGEARAEAAGSADAARKAAADASTEVRKIAQTVRLISLNAAVEAAHAGAQGRAFGTIATEIRALSERTHAASRRIDEAVEAMMDRLHPSASRPARPPGS